jgi:oxalate decarboxylase/phosphoglucose isomerase-like protein (cupin superfamily)
MVDDSQTFPVGPGQAVFIPRGAFHSTVNTGWEPLVLLALYAPAGAEQVLKQLPDHREHAPGEPPALLRG